SSLVDVTRHRTRTYERSRAHSRIGEQLVNRVLGAVYEVQHSSRKSGFIGEFDETHRGAWNFVGRLQHKRIAAGDRHWEHPQRNHEREVERSDADANADGMPGRPGVDARADTIDGVTHHQCWNTTGKLNTLDAPLVRAASLFESLAVLLGDQRDQF